MASCKDLVCNGDGLKNESIFGLEMKSRLVQVQPWPTLIDYSFVLLLILSFHIQDVPKTNLIQP